MNEGDRIKDLRKCDYGEGAIVGHVKDGEEYWIIRWDNSGLDNEWLEGHEFKVIPLPEANKAFIFPNGNVVVCDKKGEQIPELQGSWINFDYLRRFAEVAIKDNIRVIGIKQMTGAAQDSFTAYFRNATRQLRDCTCNDYPHHELCGAVQDYPDQEK